MILPLEKLEALQQQTIKQSHPGHVHELQWQCISSGRTQCSAITDADLQNRNTDHCRNQIHLVERTGDGSHSRPDDKAEERHQ